METFSAIVMANGSAIYVLFGEAHVTICASDVPAIPIATAYIVRTTLPGIITGNVFAIQIGLGKDARTTKSSRSRRPETVTRNVLVDAQVRLQEIASGVF
jgi:hypothetical protein